MFLAVGALSSSNSSAKSKVRMIYQQCQIANRLNTYLPQTISSATEIEWIIEVINDSCRPFPFLVKYFFYILFKLLGTCHCYCFNSTVHVCTFKIFINNF